MSNSSGVVIVKNDRQKMIDRVQALAGKAVYVGVPSDKVDRSAAGGGGSPTNAEIAYWMEFGVPSQNIPARPSIVPGIKMALGKVIRHLKDGAQDTLDTGDPAGVIDGLNKAGIDAVSSIKRKIVDGPFVPIADATLAARRRRGNEMDSPLRDTRQFFRSITYVVRKA